VEGGVGCEKGMGGGRDEKGKGEWEGRRGEEVKKEKACRKKSVLDKNLQNKSGSRAKLKSRSELTLGLFRSRRTNKSRGKVIPGSLRGSGFNVEQELGGRGTRQGCEQFTPRVKTGEKMKSRFLSRLPRLPTRAQRRAA